MGPSFRVWINALLYLLTFAALSVGGWLVMNAPPDFQQGHAVKILYIHVPSAKMAMLMYAVLTIGSILYLWKRYEQADIIAEAATLVGTAFAAVTLASGSIWGKPMWGAWWAWDARLTSVLVLLILYVGLGAVRHAFDDPDKSARAAAVMAIVGAVDLPIIHYSVVWWRTLHQPASMGGAAKSAITGDLLPPLLVMSIAFVLLGTTMTLIKACGIRARRRLLQLEAERTTHAI